jgi:hypothetical protein
MNGGALDAFKFFIESSSLQQFPTETFTQRALLLRLLFSIRDIDVNRVVQKLEDNAIFIGTYNAKHLSNIHNVQKLTTFDAENTLTLFQSFDVDDIADVVSESLSAFQDSVKSSPLLSLRVIFEQNFGAVENAPTVFMQLFLALYNQECNRDEVILKVFQKLRPSYNIQDIVLRILGHNHANVSADSLEIDLCNLLRFVRTDTTVCSHARAATGNAWHSTATPLPVELKTRTFRLHLTTLRKAVLQTKSGNDQAHDATVLTWKPKSLPCVQETWQTLSRAQQQSIILLSCIKKNSIADVDASISRIFTHHNPESQLFAAFEPDFTENERVAEFIIALMTRFSYSVDMEKNEELLFINNFIEECFESALGVTQRAMMSTTLKLQIFVTCYLRDQVRRLVFASVVNSFNERAFASNKAKYFPNFMTTHVQTLVDRWGAKQKFPDTIVKFVLMPLCI